MKKILFVDDEENVLKGLQRMLRSTRHEWETSFVDSGQEALALMAKEPFDIVISDMRMPGMDGAALLNEVKKLYPQTIRIILSGQATEASVLQSLGPTHQYLAKPCDAEQIKQTIARSYKLREIVDKENIRQLVSQIGSLPSLPSLYTEVVKEAESENASLKKIGEIISKDIAMSAKILQLVNSAFFGLPRSVSSPVEAINLLGFERVKSLILSAQVFTKFDESKIHSFSIEQLWKHSLQVADYAKIIAKKLIDETRSSEMFYLAALLHDTGRLILAANLPEMYSQTIKYAQEKNCPLWEAEEHVFGTSHAEIGAYLMGLWGLPDIIVEAIAYHHKPSNCINRKIDPLTIVHIANSFTYIDKPISSLDDMVDIDIDYLKELGLDQKIIEWQHELFELSTV